MIRSALLRSSPERTFESLYKRHVKDVYRYCMAMLDRQADAEDATQTTFMNAYRALERGERPRDAGSWLRAVALNVCREHYRRAGRRADEVSLDEDPGDLVLEPQGPEIGDLVRGLSRLPFNQRAALVMREFEGRSVAEIGNSLEVSVPAVEALLFRARRALREQLEEQLTCSEAERAVSRQLDGALPRSERGRLRAHLRQCRDCAALARRLRAQRSSLRSLALLPLPASLKWAKLASGGAAPASAGAAASSATTGSSVIATIAGSAAAKLAVLTLAGAAAAGAGYVTLSNPRPTAARTHAHAAPVGARGIRTAALPRHASHAQRVAGATRKTARLHSTPSATTRPSAGSAARRKRSTRRQRTPAAASTPSAAPGRTTISSVKPHGNPHGAAGNSHATSSTQASHGGQKPFKGSGHAYGRTAPKKLKSPPPSNKPAIPPGQLLSHASNGTPAHSLAVP